MPELTEQEKLERRRQKRQQRILNSAENRLNKITGTAFPHRASPTPSPSTSASSLARSETPQQRRSPSPSPAAFAAAAPSTSTETLRSRKSIRPLDADPSEELGAPFAASDATLPAIDTMFGAAAAAGGGGAPPLLPNLNELFGGNGQFPFNPAMFANMQQQQQQQQPLDGVPDTSSKYWNLLHFVSMIWLGMYAVYTEWRKGGTERFASLLTMDPTHSEYPAIQFPLFWYFIILELLLHSARSMYQRGDASGGSMLAGFMQYLPPQVADTANVALRYWLIISSLVKDCLILVFVIGIAELMSASLCNNS